MKPVQVLLILLCTQGLLLACGSQPTSVPPSSALVPLATAQAYLQRGDTAADRHAYDRAITDYTQAIHMQPDYADEGGSKAGEPVRMGGLIGVWFCAILHPSCYVPQAWKDAPASLAAG
jgi:hypothetical protein